MRQQHYIKYLSLVTLTIVCALIQTPIHAAARTPEPPDSPTDSVALGVSPALAEVVVQPGTRSSFVVTVHNPTAQPLPVKGTPTAFKPVEDMPKYDAGIFNATRWLTLSEPTFILYPDQHKQITVTVDTPSNASPGGHYATIFFQPAVAAPTITPNTAYIGTRVGIGTMLVVEGAIREGLDVGEPKASFVNERGPVQFDVRFKNTGNVHLLPTATLEIYDFRARRIASIPVEPSIVLPGTTKVHTITWDNKGRQGRFLAKLDVSYGTRKARKTSQYHSFWVVPFLRYGVTILLLGATLFVGWKTRGRWGRAYKALIHSP